MALGKVISFYSYKGGSGRSMALANVAWALACAGNRVAAIDWDLEAPGLHKYFAPFLLDRTLRASDGLMDAIVEYASEAVSFEEMTPEVLGALHPESEQRQSDWYRRLSDLSRYAIALEWEFPNGGSLDLIPSGRQGPAYATRVNSFSWQNFYDRLGGWNFIESVKSQLLHDGYDYVLIDSRTGVSDTSGICTVQLPDIVIVCFTLNNQSIDGAAAVAESIQAELIARGRGDVTIFAVPTRVDQSEKNRLERKREVAARAFDAVLPKHVRLQAMSYWYEVEVPYVPFYAYDEILAIFKDNVSDPKSTLSAYVRIISWITGQRIPLSALQISESARRQVLSELGGIEEETALAVQVTRDSVPEFEVPAFNMALELLAGEERKGIDALSTSAENLSQISPELKSVIWSSSVRQMIDMFHRYDRESVHQQVQLLRESTSANICLMSAGVLSGLALLGSNFNSRLVYLISGNLGDRIGGIVGLSLGAAILALGAMSAMFTFRMRGGDRLRRWLTTRGMAEVARLQIFRAIASGTAASGPSAAGCGLAIVCRHLLDDQRDWLVARAARHRFSLDVTNRWNGVAVAFMLVGGSGALVGGFSPEYGWLALSGVVGAAIAAYGLNREALRRDEANADRYEKAAAALDEIAKRIDAVAERISVGQTSSIVVFVDCMAKLLRSEHVQWLDGTQQAESVLAELDEQLSELGEKQLRVVSARGPLLVVG